MEIGLDTFKNLVNFNPESYNSNDMGEKGGGEVPSGTVSLSDLLAMKGGDVDQRDLPVGNTANLLVKTEFLNGLRKSLKDKGLAGTLLAKKFIDGAELKLLGKKVHGRYDAKIADADLQKTTIVDLLGQLEELGMIRRDGDNNRWFLSEVARMTYGSGRSEKKDGGEGYIGLLEDTTYDEIKKDDEIRYVVRKELSSLAEKDIKNIVDDVVRAKVSAAFEKNGISALQGDVWMNEEKHIPIKKVRLFVPSVTNPLHLKEQRFKSDAEYKREYHVANESNYAMAIYEGKDGKGKIRRSFKLINNLEASGLVKMGVKDIVGSHDEKGYQLLCTLKIGTMVIFYENDREEVINATSEEIAKRLYKTVGLSKMKVKQYEFGSLVFLHHEEARASTEIKYNNGAWSSRDEYRPKIGIYHTQLKALVEGSDFIMSKTGKITFLRND